jgi:small subunit ribosomal protein S20
LPNIKAAEKWMRQTEKRTIRNKNTKTRLKTIYKKAVATGDAEAGRTVESEFDRAASKGVIHPNKAARKKSRLAAAIKRAAATPAKPVRNKAAKAKPGAKKKKTAS